MFVFCSDAEIMRQKQKAKEAAKQSPNDAGSSKK